MPDSLSLALARARSFLLSLSLCLSLSLPLSLSLYLCKANFSKATPSSLGQGTPVDVGMEAFGVYISHVFWYL